MISLAEARQILNDIKVSPALETVFLDKARKRILAQQVVSGIDMPPFDKSAMDGYAVISGDDSPRFKIVETISAGSVPQQKIAKGECARIMTGAPLPPGADKVVIKEHTGEEAGCLVVQKQSDRRNICYRGEDVGVGDVVLHRGELIGPAQVGVLAAMGLKTVEVFRQPLVGLLTTGSEIKEPGETLQPGQIYNSNAYSLSAQVERLGGLVRYRGIVKDEPADIKEKISDMLAACDLVLISGGVSMGEYDYVPGILAELGAFIHFSKVAVKPGKPTVFADCGGKPVFGLPGNPVSTFVIFEVMVRPLLYRLMGRHDAPPLLTGTMAEDYIPRHSGRTAFIPVTYNMGEVALVDYHGSAHILALTRANGLLEIPVGVAKISRGITVYVRPI
jgi:molybdopterin molybdotransferase